MIFILVFFIFINISTVSANTYKLDFENTLIDGNQKKVNTYEEVGVDCPLAIRVTISNPNNVWIKIDSVKFVAKSYKNNQIFDVIHNQDYGVDTKTAPMTEIYIPPQKTEDIYIILDAYNLLEVDERIGSWEIDLEENVEGIVCFESTNLNEINSNSINIETIKGNLIQFTVAKEPVKIRYGLINFIPGLNDINPIVDFIGTILGILASATILWNRIPK